MPFISPKPFLPFPPAPPRPTSSRSAPHPHFPLPPLYHHHHHHHRHHHHLCPLYSFCPCCVSYVKPFISIPSFFPRRCARSWTLMKKSLTPPPLHSSVPPLPSFLPPLPLTSLPPSPFPPSPTLVLPFSRAGHRHRAPNLIQSFGRRGGGGAVLGLQGASTVKSFGVLMIGTERTTVLAVDHAPPPPATTPNAHSLGLGNR
ncbi:hypothetical protein BJV74DRAFT_363381 [Russula compacta]|nr:hypothetical protein BJV74DRAFT_363381 [Russula compacta]